MADLFDVSIRDLEQWSAGEPLDHDKLNEPVDAINQLLQGVQPPVQVVPQVPPGDTGRVQFAWASVNAVSLDLLFCYLLEEDTLSDPGSEGSQSESTIKVAKPRLLRGSTNLSHNGVTFTGYIGDGQERTANKTANETQVVVPAYVNGDVILIAKVQSSLLNEGTAEEPATATILANWLDLNVDARAWARKAS